MTIRPPVGGAFNVKAYGAVGDGVTDDTAAIQAAIDAASPTGSWGVTGAAVVFPSGEYVVRDTITLSRWAGALSGQGVGNSPSYSPSPGWASVIRWAGASDRPMILVTDSRGLAFENLRLEGSDANPPTYGIEFRSVAGAAAGTNEHLAVRGCWIGAGTWSSQGTNKGAMGAGIGFTGLNANNDQFHISDTALNKVGIGVSIKNSQSIWGLLTNVCFIGCTTAGVSSAASFTAINVTFVSNAIDVKAVGYPRINVHGWWSEQSKMIYDMANGAALAVYGGKWLISSPMQGAASINARNAIGSDLTLRDLDVSYEITPKPTLYAHGTYSPIPCYVTITSCRGLDLATLDVQGYADPEYPTFADISTGGVTVKTLITNKGLATYVKPQTKTGSYSLKDGEIAPLIANGPYIAITLPDARGGASVTHTRAGATRFTVKNVHPTPCTVASSGGTINGAETISLAQWASATFVPDGTNWLTI